MQDGSLKHEAYLLFPVHLDGTLLDIAEAMQLKKESFTTITVLHIFRQVHSSSSLPLVYLFFDSEFVLLMEAIFLQELISIE